MNNEKPNNSIFLVEDDEDIRQMLHEFLEGENFEIESFTEFDNLKAHLDKSKTLPDIFILDLMLPGKNGIEISQYLRETYQGPILILTAQKNDLLEVTALNEGATSYLQKPIRPHILLAHINALLRQFNLAQEPDLNKTNEALALRIETDSQTAYLNNIALELSSSEFELLTLLSQHSGKIVSRDFILNNMRQLEYDGMNRSIDMRISSIRKKLNDTKPPYKFIKTVRGKGYILTKYN